MKQKKKTKWNLKKHQWPRQNPQATATKCA